MKPRDRSLGSTRTVSLLVTLVVVSLVLILISQSPQLQPLQDGLRSVVAPIQSGVNGATGTITGWMDTLRDMDNLRRQNEQLRQEVESLTSENTQVQDLKRQITELQRQLNFEREFPDLTGRGAVVLGRDPSGISQIIVIDKGSADGIVADQAVTDSGGYFIGRVRAIVGAHQAQVLLITDVDSSIGVYVDRTGSNGLVEGRWPSGLLRVRHLPQDVSLGKGDFIKTAGSGLVPRGLLLGQIYNVVANDIQTEQEADAYPLANLGALDQVLVIMSGQGAPQPTATPTPTLSPTPTARPTITATPTPRGHK